MPHVSIKIYPGKTEDQKKQLADEITKDFIELFQYKEGAISITIEDVERDQWKEEVYKKEILDKSDRLYKKPGYEM